MAIGAVELGRVSAPEASDTYTEFPQAVIDMTDDLFDKGDEERAMKILDLWDSGVDLENLLSSVVEYDPTPVDPGQTVFVYI